MRNSVSALLLIALAGQLSGCGKSLSEQEMKALQDKYAQDQGASKYSLNDGVLVCLRQVKARLGDDAKVAEVSSYFHKPEKLEDRGMDQAKPGALRSCRVDYQDPANPNKMLRQDMQVKTGEFSDPKPLEISVIGDKAKFNLSDHVVPIKMWNLDAVDKLISAQSPAAEKVFSVYQLDSANLRMNTIKGHFEVTVGFAGRLKGNDLLESKGVGVLPNGTKVTTAFK